MKLGTLLNFKHSRVSSDWCPASVRYGDYKWSEFFARMWWGDV